MASKAQGQPTKEFFVGMLTRDIALSDAILDLLDNCLDGVVRQKRGINRRNSTDFYAGFYSDITISQDAFIMQDNCGGIPRDTAEKYAFRMGRSDAKEDDDLATVGIYGIGMKRAIFKIGKSATVTTYNDGHGYTVSVPANWVTETDWDFPITDIPDQIDQPQNGTIVEVHDLNPDIDQLWNTEDKRSKYVDDLIKVIQKSYSFIILKGFRINVNGKTVEALPLELLFQDSPDQSIKPFMFKNSYDGVDVSLAIGLYAPPPSPDELDEETSMRRTSADAGWTVVCNDRVVLYNDKSHLTGWGEAGVPQYHTQFIGIRGIVIFESNNPKKLPMTTTKRGVDTTSSLYAAVKDKMREGLKLFTDYTNRWKGQNIREREFSGVAPAVSVDVLLGRSGKQQEFDNINFSKSRKGAGEVFKPTLPKPQTETPYRRISYSRSLDEIQDLKEFFYHDRDSDATPSLVGERCFQYALDAVHEAHQE